MRSLTLAQQARLFQRHVNVHGRLEVGRVDENGFLVWHDVTALGGYNWFRGARISEKTSETAISGSVRLFKRAGTASLAPLLRSSALNRLGNGEYSPLLAPGRLARFSTAVTDPGVAPVAEDWTEIFQARVNKTNWNSGENQVEVTFTDLSMFITTAFIEEAKAYSNDDPGEFMTDVVQHILDDNMGSNAPDLYVPDPPGWVIKQFEQSQESTYEAIRNLAIQIGYDIRYRYDANDNFRLTLIRPERDVAAPALIIPKHFYLAVEDITVDDKDVRNVIEIEYFNAGIGGMDTWKIEDAASISQHGRRYAKFGESSTSNINTQTEADDFAQAILADLKQSPLPFQIRTRYLWPVQLYDYLGFEPDGENFDVQENLAITSIDHEFENGDAWTTLGVSGKPSIAGSEWIKHEYPTDNPPPSDVFILGYSHNWILGPAGPGAPGANYGAYLRMSLEADKGVQAVETRVRLFDANGDLIEYFNGEGELVSEAVQVYRSVPGDAQRFTFNARLWEDHGFFTPYNLTTLTEGHVEITMVPYPILFPGTGTVPDARGGLPGPPRRIEIPAPASAPPGTTIQVGAESYAHESIQFDPTQFAVMETASGPVVQVTDAGGGEDFAPLVHASRHATGGADPITPAMIGAAAATHGHDLTDANITGILPLAQLPAAVALVNTAETVTGRWEFRDLVLDPAYYSPGVPYTDSVGDVHMVPSSSAAEGYAFRWRSGQPEWDEVREVPPAVEANRVLMTTAPGVYSWQPFAAGVASVEGDDPIIVGGTVDGGNGRWSGLVSIGLDWTSLDSVYAQLSALANYVPTSRTISAGAGLTGGGTLAANRTFSFDTAWGDARYVQPSALAAYAPVHNPILTGLIGLTGSNRINVYNADSGYGHIAFFMRHNGTNHVNTHASLPGAAFRYAASGGFAWRVSTTTGSDTVATLATRWEVSAAGALTVGTVPAARVSAGTFGNGEFTFTSDSSARAATFRNTNNNRVHAAFETTIGGNVGYIGSGALFSASLDADFGLRSEGDLVLSSGGPAIRLRIAADGSSSFAGSVAAPSFIEGGVLLENKYPSKAATTTISGQWTFRDIRLDVPAYYQAGVMFVRSNTLVDTVPDSEAVDGYVLKYDASPGVMRPVWAESNELTPPTVANQIPVSTSPGFWQWQSIATVAGVSSVASADDNVVQVAGTLGSGPEWGGDITVWLDYPILFNELDGRYQRTLTFGSGLTYNASTRTVNTAALQILSAGAGLSGSNYNGATARTWSVDTSTIATRAYVDGAVGGIKNLASSGSANIDNGATEPRNMPFGLTHSFEGNSAGSTSGGWPGPYGNVLTMHSYSAGQDGGVFQLWSPYDAGSSYGDFQIRHGDYNNAGWNGWFRLLHSGNSGALAIAPTNAGTYGAVQINGAKGGYSGIYFTGGNSPRYLMVNGSLQGIHNGSTWDWYWSNGVLTAGTVPADHVSAGTFGTGHYEFPNRLSVSDGNGSTYTSNGGALALKNYLSFHDAAGTRLGYINPYSTGSTWRVRSEAAGIDIVFDVVSSERLRLRASNGIAVPQNHAIYLDGGGDTYIQSHTTDQFRVVVGGGERIEVTTGTTSIRTSNTALSGNLSVTSGTTTVDTITSLGLATFLNAVESSARWLKHDIRDLTVQEAREAVYGTRGRFFRWNETGLPDWGFIGDEVPWALSVKDRSAVRYSRAVVPLTVLAREHDTQLERQKREIERLRNEVESLRHELAVLRANPTEQVYA